jgi:hypothetical protein
MTDKLEGSIFVPLKRESPAGRQHLHTLTAGAWLPFMVSIITGLICGVITLVLASDLRARSPWAWTSTIAVIAWGLTWLQHMKHWFSLTRLEEVTRLDLNQDGVIGEPQKIPSERVIHVRMEEVNNDGAWHQQRFDLPATSEQMEELAIGLMHQGLPFTRREWAGPNAPFSDAEFRELRRELIKRELVKMTSDHDARQGIKLTLAGRKMLEQFLPDAPSPTGELD